MPCPPGSLEAPPGARVNHREWLVGDFGQDIGRRFKKSRRLFGQDQHAVPRRPVEREDKIAGRECRVDHDACLHLERKVNRRRRSFTGKKGETVQSVFPVDLVDQLVEVLHEGSDLSLLEFAVKTLRVPWPRGS